MGIAGSAFGQIIDALLAMPPKGVQMETSTVQSIKLAIVSATGLSKDALHIYVGLIVFFAMMRILRRQAHRFMPLLTVFIAACCGEVLDRRDDLHSLGYWRLDASLHDVINTLFWPFVIDLCVRKGWLFKPQT